MKNNYIKKQGKVTLAIMLISMAMFLVPTQNMAQTVKVVDDGAILSDVINGDTTSTGERNDENTIYELKMGGIYYCASAISLKSKLHIRSEGGSGFLPAILAKADDSNKWPQTINTGGDITLEGIYLSNKNGDDANPKWGGFRAAGTDSRVILKDCQFEYDKACTIQLRADGIKLYIDNCKASKTGNFKEYNGNGRLVDTRGYKTDSIVVKNTTVYYMQDRLVRNMGGEINYLEFDHVTVVNNQGFHGCFAMARVHSAKITNNLVINGQYGGDHPNVKEQTSTNPDDNLKIYMITMDTIYSDTKLEIHHNNIAFTSDLLDYFNTIDSVAKPEVLSPTIASVLGDAAADAYFEEVVEFTSMPDVPWDFLRSIYATPDAAPHPSNWPDEIGISNIDAGYSDWFSSATADENGEQVGDQSWDITVGIFGSKASQNSLNINVYPNPVKGQATFAYTLTQATTVSLTIYDVTGKIVKAVETDFQIEGDYELKWDGTSLTNGLYMYTLQTKNETKSGKITLSK